MAESHRPDSVSTESNPSGADNEQSSRVVDVAIVVVAILAVSYRISLLNDAWFFVDDWRLGLRTLGPSGLVTGYNGHLSTIIVATYWVVLNVFGFSTYLPFKIVAGAALTSVGVALYFTTRRRIGAMLAALAAVFLLFPGRIDLTVAAFNHYLALTFGIFCAAVLNRPESRRSNTWVAVLLALSLASAGGGVAVAAGALIFCCCTRPSWRRWVAVAVPSGLWAVWGFGLTGLRGSDGKLVHPSVGDLVSSLGPGLVRMLQGFGPSEILSVVFSLAFLVRAVFCLKSGVRRSANLLAWTGSFAVWMVGLGWTRDAYNNLAFRYHFVALGFLMLAMMPMEPIRHDWLRPLRTTKAAALGVAAILLSAGILAIATNSSAKESAKTLNTIGIRNRMVADYIRLGPEVVPDTYYEGMWFYGSTAGQVRALFARFSGTLTPQARDRAALRHVSVVRDQPDQREPVWCASSWAGGLLPHGKYLLTVPPGPSVDLVAHYLGPVSQTLAVLPGGSSWLLEVPSVQDGVDLHVFLRPARSGSHMVALGGTVACLD